MLIRYFTRPSRIKELRTNPGGHLRGSRGDLLRLFTTRRHSHDFGAC